MSHGWRDQFWVLHVKRDWEPLIHKQGSSSREASFFLGHDYPRRPCKSASSASVSLGWGLRLCIVNKLPEDTDTVGTWITLE